MSSWAQTAIANIKSMARALISIARPYRRYVVITPPLSKLQAVFSKDDRRFLFYRIRSYIDYLVLAQVFVAEDYDLHAGRGREIIARYRDIVARGGTPLIIDGGANIGLSTAFFARQFPQARIVAVEPDGGNLKQARLNCRAPQVRYVEAGLASENGRGTIVDPKLGAWGYRTEWNDGGALHMVSIPQILDDNKDAVPLIVKIDIEGFESELFSKNTEWVNRFPLLIIELHDWMLPGTANSAAFLKTIAACGRDFVSKGENIFSYANPGA